MATQAKTEQEITSWCRDYISNALGVPADSIDSNQEFDALGLDSAVITSMLIELEEWLGLDIPASTFFVQSTLGAMGTALAERSASESLGA
jgi:acyl carrier protein